MGKSLGGDLQQIWYDAVVKAFGLSPETFLIAGSMMPLGLTSRELWDFYDVIPAHLEGRFYEPTFNRFSDGYGAVVNLIIPQFGSEWREAVGDYYPRWVDFLESDPEIPVGGMLELFSGWVRSALPDPVRAEAAISAYRGVIYSTVPASQARFIEAHGNFAFTRSMKEASTAAQGAPSYSFTINCEPGAGGTSASLPRWMSKSLRPLAERSKMHRQAEAALRKLLTERVEGQAKFDHQTKVDAQPLQSRQMVGNKVYPAWFSSAALDLAYQTPGDPVWPAGIKPTWEQTFGSTGSLQRLVTSVVLVDGVDVELESHAEFSDEEMRALQQAAAAGITPLFAMPPTAEKSLAPQLRWSVSSQSGSFKIYIRSPPGRVLVFGVVATPIGQAEAILAVAAGSAGRIFTAS